MSAPPDARPGLQRRRAVVVAVGSGGDVAPLAAAAGRLAARGLQTTLMAPRRYAALAPAGVDFSPAGADAVFESVFSAPAVWTARHGLAESWRYYGAAALSTLEQIRQGWSPEDTVLVASSFAVGARLAARAHGYHDTTVHLSPGVLFSHARPPRWPAASIPTWWPRGLQAAAAATAERLALDPVIRRALAPAWRAAGLPKENRLFSRFIHSTHRVVYLFPEWFAAAAPDWPACGRHAGFGRPAALVTDMPQGVASFIAAAGDALAVITAGTAVDAPPPWVARCTEALVRQGLFVLVLGRNAGPGGTRADGRVVTAPLAPLGEILPRARLLVHHGGIGTAADALRAGVPQWLFPTAHDQADNAQRLVDLGAGRRFEAGTTPAVLADAASALSRSGLRARALTLQSRLRDEPDGIDRLADEVMADARQTLGRDAHLRQGPQEDAAVRHAASPAH
jgi:rhamnosyltransferase subunit B